MGRPTKYNPQLAAAICRELIFRQLDEVLAARAPKLPGFEDSMLPTERTFYNWLLPREELQWLYRWAKEIRSERMGEECIAIADQALDVPKANLRINTRLKLMACWAPKVYGRPMAGINPYDDMEEDEVDEFLAEAERKREAARLLASESLEGQEAAHKPSRRAKKAGAAPGQVPDRAKPAAGEIPPQP